MLPLPELSAHVDKLIQTSKLALERPKSQPLDQPLPRSWLALQAGERQPMWIAIACQLFSGHWSKAQQRAVLRCAMDFWLGHRPGGYFGLDCPGGVTPERVLLLAAFANGWDDTALLSKPISLQDRLLCAALHYRADTNKFQEPSAPHGPVPLKTLELIQMLVFGSGSKQRPRLLALRLRAFDSKPAAGDDLSHSDARRLIPDVGACLLGLDEDFRRGLDEIQTLLDAVVKFEDQGTPPPAIAWSLYLLPSPGDSVQQVEQLQGASATATVAYGALYLLSRHLNTSLPHVEAIVEDLLTIDDPGGVSITAQFKHYENPGQTWSHHWPDLVIVGGAADKLHGLDGQLPNGRHVPHRFVAQGQSDYDGVDLTTFGAYEATDLGDLLRQISRQTSPLDADERRLQVALLTLDKQQVPADTPTMQAMQRISSRSAPGAGVRKHLLWRYAQLCSGQPSPFGNVAQIGQHFVSLIVEGPRGHGADPNYPQDLFNETPSNGPQSLRRSDLRSIFCPIDPQDQQRWNSVPAWVILAPPFAGKTTLLNVWELSCIRGALKRQFDTGQWGEVPVFLPLNAFARSRRTAEASAVPSAEQLGQALTDFARLEAPALPWSELLPAVVPTQEQLRTPRQDGLRLRLCIDSLNEYRTGQANESDAITCLCEWLAPRCDPKAPGALLPPVFSVRREEKGNFELKALKGHWMAHEISVQPWGPSQMRAYVRQRRLPAEAEAKLLAALGLPGAEATDEQLISADENGPANPLASLCTVPGFLSAQCTLLAHWPHLQPSERRAEVMLALAWYSLDGWRGSAAFESLKARALSNPAMSRLRDWLLPPSVQRALKAIQDPTISNPAIRWGPGEAGGLIEGLTQVALALQDALGGAREAAPWRDLRALSSLAQAVEKLFVQPLLAAEPILHADEWLAQANASGLAIIKNQQRDEDGWPEPWLRYSHQQIQEFFSALSVTPNTLPDLAPPPFRIAADALDNYLSTKGKFRQLELPVVTPHTERLRYATDLAKTTGAEQLITAVLHRGNLALASQLAIDQLARLEPPLDNSGRVVSRGFWFAERRHPLLQHLRARLLLACVDTGAATLSKLHASGILAGIADTVRHLPDPWRGQWAPLLAMLSDPGVVPPAFDPAPGWPAPLTVGVDLRQRLQYGLLLGKLGDPIRYERVSATVEAQERIGIRLKAEHWALIPASSPGVIHRIGSDRKEGDGRNNHPAWTVPDGELPTTLFAHTPAVVMQWQAFWEDPLAQGKPTTQPRTLNNQHFAHSLLPITAINWFAAQAFTAWAAPFHQALADRLPAFVPGELPAELGLPTEVQHEAAVRFYPAQQDWWLHDGANRIAPSDLPPTLFNHSHTRWNGPAPVSVFSAALSPSGIEAMGNVWTWCSNLLTENYHGDNARRSNLAQAINAVRVTQWPWLALRGGSFGHSATSALATFRGHCSPGSDYDHIGMRWQMSRPIS